MGWMSMTPQSPTLVSSRWTVWESSGCGLVERGVPLGVGFEVLNSFAKSGLCLSLSLRLCLSVCLFLCHEQI